MREKERMSRMKAGFVSFIGRPNVGKSTLLNMFIGKKIAIMSPTAQTTRTTIQGIKTTERGQIIVVDTPGIHKPKDALGYFMNGVASSTSEGVDVAAILLPADESIGKGDEFIIEQMKALGSETKKIAIISKIDKVPKEKLLRKVMKISVKFEFDAIIPVSAKKSDNLERLEDVLFDLLPESELLYDRDTVTSQSDTFIVKEFIREKVFHLTKEEIPHAVAVIIEKWEETEAGIEIMAAIVVERKSQKSIIIGKQGSMIKEIRQQAERDLKRHFQEKVLLELWVKVEKNWRSNPKYLHEFGYDIKDYE